MMNSLKAKLISEKIASHLRVGDFLGFLGNSWSVMLENWAMALPSDLRSSESWCTSSSLFRREERRSTSTLTPVLPVSVVVLCRELWVQAVAYLRHVYTAQRVVRAPDRQTLKEVEAFTRSKTEQWQDQKLFKRIRNLKKRTSGLWR